MSYPAAFQKRLEYACNLKHGGSIKARPKSKTLNINIMCQKKNMLHGPSMIHNLHTDPEPVVRPVERGRLRPPARL
jgi:hypothetical protein